MVFGRSGGVQGHGMDHTKRSPRTLAGFGLTWHGEVDLHVFWFFLSLSDAVAMLDLINFRPSVPQTEGYWCFFIPLCPHCTTRSLGGHQRNSAPRSLDFPKWAPQRGHPGSLWRSQASVNELGKIEFFAKKHFFLQFRLKLVRSRGVREDRTDHTNLFFSKFHQIWSYKTSESPLFDIWR